MTGQQELRRARPNEPLKGAQHPSELRLKTAGAHRGSVSQRLSAGPLGRALAKEQSTHSPGRLRPSGFLRGGVGNDTCPGAEITGAKCLAKYLSPSQHRCRRMTCRLRAEAGRALGRPVLYADIR